MSYRYGAWRGGPDPLEPPFDVAGALDRLGERVLSGDRAADALVAFLAPVRERYAELRGDEQTLEAILAEGAEKARAMAGETLGDVRAAMGFAPPA